MSTQGINQLLGELRAMSSLAAGQAPAVDKTAPEVDFSDVLKSTLEQVNQVQSTSLELQKQFDPHGVFATGRLFDNPGA